MVSTCSSWGYRQWKYLKEIGQPDSIKGKKQIERFNLIISQWERAINEKKEVIVIMDTNVDTLTNANHNSTFKIDQLSQILQNHLQTFNITQHNHKPTHY